MSSKHDPCRPIHFLVFHADTLTPPPPASSCHASVREAYSAFVSISADVGLREPEPSKTSAEGAQRCNGDVPAENEWLGTAARIDHSMVSGEDSDGAHNARSEEQGGRRHASLVRMKLYPDIALPPALSSKKCAADILKEVWHCSETPPPIAVRTRGAHERDALKRGPVPAQAPVSPTELNDLIHELLSIGFASAREQKLLRTSPLAAWARILPSVTTRLLMLGLAPTHYILEEARRRRKSLRDDTGSAIKNSYPLVRSVPDDHPESALPATTDENPLLGNDGGDAGMNPRSVGTELRGSAQHDDSDRGKSGANGPLLKVEFKQEPLGCTANGKRKRGGAQLHVRMRLGAISLQEPYSAPVNAPPERSASGSGVAGAIENSTYEAPIFGCITGELLEVNEALNNDADVLLEPPEKGGWIFIAKPAKKLASHWSHPFLSTRRQQGWGIFVEEQEAFAFAPSSPQLSGRALS